MNNCKNCKADTIGTYCSNKCQHEYQNNKTILEWKQKPETGIKSGGRLKSAVRRYIFEKFDYKCSQCAWDEKNPITGKPPLEIDHIDGNSTNNSEENLRLLCPNCHSLTPTWKALNAGKGNKKKLRYFNLGR